MSLVKKLLLTLAVACSYFSGDARHIMNNASQASERGADSSGASCGG